MPVIEVDISDHLDEISTEELRAELATRSAGSATDEPEPWTPGGLAADLRTAFYLRDANRFEMLLRVLEPHDPRRTMHWQ